MKETIKPLDEIKDEVAKEYGYVMGWQHMIDDTVMDYRSDIAAERYADQFRVRAESSEKELSALKLAHPKIFMPPHVVEAFDFVNKCDSDFGFMGSPKYYEMRRIIMQYQDGIKEE